MFPHYCSPLEGMFTYPFLVWTILLLLCILVGLFLVTCKIGITALGCGVMMLGAISDKLTASTFYPEDGIDLLDYTASHRQTVILCNSINFYTGWCI